MPIRPGNEGANLLRSRWDAEIKAQPMEEAVITKYFSRPTGVEKNEMLNLLYLRVLPTIAAQTLAAGGTGQILAYHTGSPTAITVTPSFNSAAVEIPKHLETRLGDPDNAKVLAAYRRQLMKALAEAYDATAAQLATAISNQLGPDNFSINWTADIKGTILTNAKDHVQQNEDDLMVHLVYHPSQDKFFTVINQLMAAYSSGLPGQSYAKGIVFKAHGLTLRESGNIYVANNVAHNMCFTRDAFVFARNAPETMLDPQAFELTTRHIAFCETGSAEVFDQDAVDFRSPV